MGDGRLSTEGSQRSEPTLIPPQVSSDVFLPPHGLWEGDFEGLCQRTSAPSPQTEALTQQTGWEGPGRGGILFLWLLYFFGLWLFDNSSKNSL